LAGDEFPGPIERIDQRKLRPSASACARILSDSTGRRQKLAETGVMIASDASSVGR